MNSFNQAGLVAAFLLQSAVSAQPTMADEQWGAQFLGRDPCPSLEGAAWASCVAEFVQRTRREHGLPPVAEPLLNMWSDSAATYTDGSRYRRGYQCGTYISLEGMRGCMKAFKKGVIWPARDASYRVALSKDQSLTDLRNWTNPRYKSPYAGMSSAEIQAGIELNEAKQDLSRAKAKAGALDLRCPKDKCY